MAGKHYMDSGYTIEIPPCTYCGMPMNGPHMTKYCPGDPTAVPRLLAIVEDHERRITAVEQRMDEIERRYGAVEPKRDEPQS